MLVNSVNTQVMLPSGSTTKRKASSDDLNNPLLAAHKRLKKDKPSTGKRKFLNAEETPSGLFIIRTAPSQDSAPFSASQPLPSSSSSSSSSLLSHNAPPRSSSQPPSKKFRASSTHHYTAPSPIPEDPEIESAVRAMNDEAQSLRRQSRLPTVMDQNINPAFQFPVDGPSGKKYKGKGREVVVDTSALVEQDESPVIKRNKQLREGAMAAIVSDREEGGPPSERVGRGQERGKDHRRRSSLSRGKRISSGFEMTGVIASPHNSVSEGSFHKHIDMDLPDSERLRQLLIWCTIRASGSTTFSSSSTPSKPKVLLPKKDVQLPKMTDKATNLLRRLQDNNVRGLAERKIDLSVYGHHQSDLSNRGEGGSGGADGKTVKENEQNKKNKNFEVKYSQQIRQFEEEEDQWKKVNYRYDEYAKRFQQAMERRVADAMMSAKAKGKRRLIETEEDLNQLLPDRVDLASDLRRSLDLAPTVLFPSGSSSSSSSLISSSTTKRTIRQPTRVLTTRDGVTLTCDELTATINELEPDMVYKLDRLHSFVHAAQSATRVVEEMLNERNRLLVDNLEKRRGVNVVGGSGRESTGTGIGGVDVVKNYVGKEVAPFHVRDVVPCSGTTTTMTMTRGKEGGGGLMDLMRALSHIDNARHPSKVGDQVRRAQREVKRVQGDNNGSGGVAFASHSSGNGVGGGGEMDHRRRLTAVYPPGILSGGGSGGVVMTPRKVPGTPRRERTPAR